VVPEDKVHPLNWTRMATFLMNIQGLDWYTQKKGNRPWASLAL
jgi:hypothetical protein